MEPRHFAVEPHVQKIAVLRANRLGDLVFVLPALDALRAAYPHAEIVLLGFSWYEDLLAGRPGPVDRVIVVPPCWNPLEGFPAGAEPPELAAFFAAMQRERFDLAIQLLGGGRHSNPFVQRLGARLTVGLKAPDAVALDRWVPYILYQPEIFRYLEVVALVGAPPVTFEPRLAVTLQDLAEAAVVPEDDRPLAVIHPGASDSRRRWPATEFAAVGDALAAAGAQVAVIGMAEERDLVQGVIGAMRAEALDLCGRLSLRALTGLLHRTSVMVGNDSGPVHLAEAVGAATVAVYWCGNLITAGPLTRARHRPIISWQLTCPACGVDCTVYRCDHPDSFVADVPVDEVRDAALDLLAASRVPALVSSPR